MDFLLETIGFPPGPATERWMSEQFRRGGPRRVPSGPDMAVFVERGQLDGPLALWPSLLGGSRQRLWVQRLGPWPPEDGPPERRLRRLHGIQALLEGRLCRSQRSTKSGSDGAPAALRFAGEPIAPAQELSACLVDDPMAVPEDGLPPLAAGQHAEFELAAFALDVEQVAAQPNQPSQRRGAPRLLASPFEPGGQRVAPLSGRQAPAGCVELELEVRRQRRQANRLTGRVYERFEAGLGDGELTLFVSRWQLEQDGLPRPEPGAWIRGCFWIEARRLAPCSRRQADDARWADEAD
jgi:hypothetical protein